MTFYNTRLSDRVSNGFQGGPEYLTTEVPNAGGYGAFISEWVEAHWTFIADYDVMDPLSQNEIRNCFMAMRGKRHSFRFKDWTDFQATNQALGTGDGTNTPRQLKKYYTFGAATVGRTILLPIATSVVVTANGSPFTVTVNDQTGMVSPATGNWPSGQILLASFYFDVRVRFGKDYYPFTMAARNLGSVSIDLKEALTP